MTTSVQDLAAARLALALKWEMMRRLCTGGDFSYSEMCCDECRSRLKHGPWCLACQGRGWVPAEWHLETLIAEAAKDRIGIRLHALPLQANDSYLTTVWAIKAGGNRSGNHTVTTDPDSILLAALRALDEVMKEKP